MTKTPNLRGRQQRNLAMVVKRTESRLLSAAFYAEDETLPRRGSVPIICICLFVDPIWPPIQAAQTPDASFVWSHHAEA